MKWWQKSYVRSKVLSTRSDGPAISELLIWRTCGRGQKTYPVNRGPLPSNSIHLLTVAINERVEPKVFQERTPPTQSPWAGTLRLPQ